MILLDMDGVLADFVTHALRLHGLEYDEATWPKGVYEMQDAFGLSPAEFWKPVNEAGADWWANLPVFPWAADLIGLCEKYGFEVGIATSPSRDGTSAAGKTTWIKTHFPKLARCMMIGPRKEWLAASDRILIDDSDEKCDAFMFSGGNAIVFPQPWNSAHRLTADRLAFVEHQVRSLRHLWRRTSF